MKKKLELKPGVWYNGRAMLNEFGEIMFNPEEKGAHEGRIKQLKKTDNYTISYSASKLIVHMSFPKEKGLLLVKSFMNIVNNILTDLRNYEI